MLLPVKFCFAKNIFRAESPQHPTETYSTPLSSFALLCDPSVETVDAKGPYHQLVHTFPEKNQIILSVGASLSVSPALSHLYTRPSTHL